jgi:phosphopentomutase
VSWQKVDRDNCYYYQVEGDEFTYSWEMAGIQMTFNKEISFEKAKQIADEVIDNIKASGQKAELIVLDSSNVYRFLTNNSSP